MGGRKEIPRRPRRFRDYLLPLSFGWDAVAGEEDASGRSPSFPCLSLLLIMRCFVYLIPVKSAGTGVQLSRVHDGWC